MKYLSVICYSFFVLLSCNKEENACRDDQNAILSHARARQAFEPLKQGGGERRRMTRIKAQLHRRLD